MLSLRALYTFWMSDPYQKIDSSMETPSQPPCYTLMLAKGHLSWLSHLQHWEEIIVCWSRSLHMWTFATGNSFVLLSEPAMEQGDPFGLFPRLLRLPVAPGTLWCCEMHPFKVWSLPRVLGLVGSEGLSRLFPGKHRFWGLVSSEIFSSLYPEAFRNSTGPHSALHTPGLPPKGTLGFRGSMSWLIPFVWRLAFNLGWSWAG